MAKKLPVSKMLWRSRRPILAVLLALLLSPILFYMMDRAKVIIEDLSETNRFIQKSWKGNTEKEKNRGCNMPQLDPFSEDIASFTKDLPVLTCEGTDWVNCCKSECNIATAIHKTIRDIVCNYKDIIYVDDRNVYSGHPTTVVGNEKYTLNKSDHVKIDCTGKDMNSPDVRAHWSGFKVGFRPVPTKPIPSDRKDSYNVMILCFDSTSRNGFIRKMRRSYNYLTEQLNAVILNSYNVVGDGATAALYPILTGKSEEEIVYRRKRTTKKKYNNSKKLIFHKLKEFGYRTAYFEDIPWTGTAQNKFIWFRKPPADHYLRASLLANIGQGENWYQSRPGRHCFGAKPQYQLMMNLADEFLQLDGKKFCFTFIVDVAYENFTVLPTADETLLSFLQTLSARKALEDTLVLIMGDHGSRFSSIRETPQGNLEERLPIMAIVLPEKLKTRRPTALTSLKNNEDALTTPFDIHATILDVLDLKEKNNTHKIPGSDLLRAMTLLEPIVMSPNKSVFEGTMTYNPAGDYFMITERDISRVSEIGDESKCISATHPHLYKYCYCKDRVGNTSINRTYFVTK